MHLWYSIVEQRSFAVLAVCVTSKLLQLMASSIAHKLTQYRQYNLLLENNTFLGLQRKIYLFIYLFNDCSRLEHYVRGSSSGCKRWITFDSKLKKDRFKLYMHYLKSIWNEMKVFLNIPTQEETPSGRYRHKQIKT